MRSWGERGQKLGGFYGNAVVKFERSPLFFDHFVVGSAVEDVRISIDFVTFAHRYFAGVFFGKELADGGYVLLGDCFAVAFACAAGVAEVHADAVFCFPDDKNVIVMLEFGIGDGGEGFRIAKN